LFGFKIETEDDYQNEFAYYDNELPQKINVNIFDYWKNNTNKVINCSKKIIIFTRFKVIIFIIILFSSSDTERDFN
jgi:hypothetical protein